jgi:prevent-host-death family protein
MKRVKIAELKDNLSKYLRAVERGAEVEVTDRDRPIARIVPIADGDDGITVIPPTRPFAGFRRRRFRPVRRRFDSLELLLEERQER